MAGAVKHMERSHRSYYAKTCNPEFSRFAMKANQKANARSLRENGGIGGFFKNLFHKNTKNK